MTARPLAIWSRSSTSSRTAAAGSSIALAVDAAGWMLSERSLAASSRSCSQATWASAASDGVLAMVDRSKSG
ncbi:MAG: hypothetical protein ACK56F_01735, partial [bacterium]